MKEGGTGLHKTIREINLVYKGLTQDMEEGKGERILYTGRKTSYRSDKVSVQVL